MRQYSEIMIKSQPLACMAGVCVFALVGTVLATDNTDWPRFRGPNGDGISKESNWNPDALKTPKIVWNTNVGKGHSSVAIVGERLYTMGSVSGNTDTVCCLDVKDGTKVWAYSYPCKNGDYPGPHSTPAVDGKSVYTLSRQGNLLCLNTDDGKVKWQKNVMSDFQAKNITWGFAGSPVVCGELLIVNAGDAGIALNKETGEKAWANSPGVGGYATPVLFNIGDIECVAIFGCKALNCLEAKTGKKVWSYKWITGCDANAADPIIKDGKIFISSGYDKGCTLIDITGPAPTEVWRNNRMKNHFSSSVLIDGFLYGINDNVGKRNSLKCLEFATGDEKWSKDLGFGELIAADGKLLMLNERGDLLVIKATPAGYEELAIAKGVLGKTCWTSPVLCRGMIYCRNNDGNLVCIDASK